MVITVKDTGIGASEERISEVLSKKSQSFGLKVHWIEFEILQQQGQICKFPAKWDINLR